MPAKALPVKLVAESVFSERRRRRRYPHPGYPRGQSRPIPYPGRADAYDYLIRLKRGGPRIFRNLATAAELIRSMGVSRIRVHPDELTRKFRSTGMSRRARQMSG
jgi:hypothetical protein